MAPQEFLPLWTAMTAAMMLPSAVPLLRLDYLAASSAVRTTVLATGYLSVWVALGGVVLALDALAADELLGMHGRRVTVALLLIAALYQLLPLKRGCLTRCRAPLGRMLLGWRDGLWGAFRMGVANGLWCAGCCAGLMVALIGLGVMSIAWMALIGGVILVEKVTPIGVRASVFVSLALAVAAIAWAL